MHVGRLFAMCAATATIAMCLAAGQAAAAGLSLSGAPLITPFAAAQPPQVRGELYYEAVFATRATVQAEIELFSAPESKWRAEYAESAAGPWTFVNGGSFGALAGGNTPEVSIGEPDGTTGGGHEEGTYRVLHHLTPDTHYYVRFSVEDPGGAASRTFEITTLAAGKPEIAREHNEADNVSTFQPSELATTTTDAYTAQIETNDATSEYHFEYTDEPANAGSWAPFSSGASGTITAAEDFGDPEAKLSGLQPETTYYVRLKASNAHGEVEESTSFTTLSARPTVGPANPRNVTATTARLEDSVSANGSATEWRYEYTTEPDNTSSWQPIPGLAGTITQEQVESLPEREGIAVEGTWTGLSPESEYCVRVYASNAAGEGFNAFQEPIVGEMRGFDCFQTAGPPTDATSSVHGLDGESVRLLGSVDPNSAPSVDEQTIAIEGDPTGGTFTLTIDGETTGATFTGTATEGSTELTGVAISSGALVKGEEVAGPGVPPGTTLVEDRGVPGKEILELSAPVTEGSSGATFTSELPYDALGEEVAKALEDLPGEPVQVTVHGFAGGPYRVIFAPTDTTAEPQFVGDGSGLTPSGTLAVATAQEGGVVYASKYHFEYVTAAKYEESGFAEAASTPEEAVPAANELQFFGADAPGLQPGESYRYRIVVSSEFPGAPTIDGAAESLIVPKAAASTQAEACPNAVLRTGPSANLPDCRAYELLSPVDKEGAQEAFNYGPKVETGAFVGEDGQHLVFEDQALSWGTQPEAGQAPYLFSRGSGTTGWTMTAGSPQPQTGVQRLVPALYNADVTQVALEAEVHTSRGAGESSEIQLETGPVGGPYTTVASVPRSEVTGGWMAASADFSTLVLQVADPHLLGTRTTTKSGDSDLYAYEEGHLTQVNAGVGTCGAKLVDGDEARGGRSSAHAVSAGGSRIFFEAVPGTECSAPTHLYMREAGGAVVDIGAYQFAGANASGTEVLLKSPSGAGQAFLLYDDEVSPATITPVYTSPSESQVRVAEEFTHIFFVDHSDDIYDYDVATGVLTKVLRLNLVGEEGLALEPSPDGGLLYFHGGVSGMPATKQMYLYDSSEDSVECISCASSFDPEPSLGAYLPTADLGPANPLNGFPKETFLSANGDYAFFDTPAALVAGDVDGEIAPTPETGVEFQADIYSPSSDVYEWRRDGVDGCQQIDGCLALVTDGRGGFLNLLLGATPSGEDVFIYTRSQLLPQDQDSSGDIYDARVDGGVPAPPPATVECEGDACSTPASPPSDTTPSSMTFVGPGNASKAAQVKRHSGKAPAGKRKAKKAKAGTKAKKRKRQARHRARSGRKRTGSKAEMHGSRSQPNGGGSRSNVRGSQPNGGRRGQ
ncbi:MAG TPA: fibronectin type III domain-containing protein [Solirubrobacteraceae bacterium]